MVNSIDKLPKGWTKIKLGEVIELKYGKSLPKSQRQEGEYAVYGSNGIIGWHSSYLTNQQCLIVGRKGSIGEINLSLSPCWPIDTTYYIDEFYQQPIRFWLYLLKSLSLSQLDRASSIPGLNRNDIYSQYINLPPLNEQYKITEKLDQLMIHQQKAKEALEKIPPLIEKFKQLVLESAFRGDLTADWRAENPDFNNSNLNNCSDPNHLIPKSWIWITLNDIIHEIQAGKNFKCSEVPVRQGTVGLLKISAVTWGEFNQKETKTVEDKSKINPALFIQKGDFLISRANTMELVGSSVIVDQIDYDIMLSDKVWRVIFIENVNQDYINYYLKSKQGRQEIEKRARGNQVSMKNISQQDFRDIKIPYPSIREQELIVKQIKKLFNPILFLEEWYNLSIQELTRLNQLILSKALRGELVPQNSDDEPASLLLERIRQEKEKLNLERTQQRKAKMTTKTLKKKKTRRQLSEVLAESQESHLSPEQLFEEAGFNQETVEPFYIELFSGIESEQIEEIRPDNTQIYLTLK